MRAFPWRIGQAPAAPTGSAPLVRRSPLATGPRRSATRRRRRRRSPRPLPDAPGPPAARRSGAAAAARGRTRGARRPRTRRTPARRRPSRRRRRAAAGAWVPRPGTARGPSALGRRVRSSEGRDLLGPLPLNHRRPRPFQFVGVHLRPRLYEPALATGKVPGQYVGTGDREHRFEVTITRVEVRGVVRPGVAPVDRDDDAEELRQARHGVLAGVGREDTRPAPAGSTRRLPSGGDRILSGVPLGTATGSLRRPLSRRVERETLPRQKALTL